MDRGKARFIGEKVMAKLKEIEDELGVTFSRGSGSYDSATYSMKVTATVDNVDGSTRTPEMMDFERHASMYGLEAENLGATFTQGGTEYEIVGMKPRSSKYPILAKSFTNGKTYKFPADTVKRLLTVTI